MKHLEVLAVLSLILVSVIILSVLLHTAKKENYLDAPRDIASTNADFSRVGLGSMSGCANGGIQSQLGFQANLDDLIASKSLKSNTTKGLIGVNSIASRSCSDSQTNATGTLLSSISSNKNNCNVEVDGQEYQLLSRNIRLKIDLRNSSERELKVVNDQDKIIELLLLRPVVLVIADSKPYNLSLGNSGYFIYSTNKVRKYYVHNQFPHKITNIGIQPAAGSYKVFPIEQSKQISQVLKEQLQGIRTSTGRGSTIHDVMVTVYYLSREENANLDTVKVENNETHKLFYTKDMMKNKIEKVLKGEVKNPVFTIKFRCKIRPDAERQTHLREWRNLLSVARGWQTCDVNGRGIALVAIRPERHRGDAVPWNAGDAKEVLPSDPNWISLDFVNVVKSVSSGAPLDGCGYYYNSLNLLIPANTEVDIMYIVGPSFKVAVATYYDQSKNKKHTTYVQNFHCYDYMNDVLSTISVLNKELAVHNLAKINGHEFEGVYVKDLQVVYGMDNMEKWYKNN